MPLMSERNNFKPWLREKRDFRKKKLDTVDNFAATFENNAYHFTLNPN